jgi:ABC-2 type transport system ATP-binding protein
MDKNIAIKVSNLTKFYGDILAVDHVTFEIPRGEIFGLLGPNGSGKTTTIRMLTGLSRPTEGEACVLGFNIHSEIVKAKRSIGVVPEMSNLYDELSAMDNLLFMAQLYGVPRRQRRKRAEEFLQVFRLYERKDHPFHTFSRGMKRSLTIAAALIHSPELLFLDEPTVGLDVVVARSLRHLIGNLHRQGITIFLTTHYLEEADLLCDRVALLVQGRIIKIDTPEALKSLAEEESIIEFAFDSEASKFVKHLSDRLPGVRVVPLDHRKVRIYGGIAPTIFDHVFQLARDNGVQIQSIHSIKPTLEDAFIKVTGLSPTIMATEKGG